jgi:hypothetical protein
MRGGTWKAIAVLTACGLSLGACATVKPQPAPIVAAEPPPAPVVEPAAAVPTPVIAKPPASPARVACVPKTLPRAPKYPDTDAALRDAGGAADRYQLMAAGRLLRERRLAELEKVVDGCR